MDDLAGFSLILNIIAYKTGASTSVRKVETIRPPIIATARGPQRGPLTARE